MDDIGTPQHLVPSVDVPVSSTRHYKTAHVTGMLGSDASRGELRHTLKLPSPLDIQTGKPVEGVLLTHTQSWHFGGTALGQLVNTVCLAPGEITQVAMQHQSRHIAENTVDHGLQVEDLSNSSTARSAVDERDNSSATERGFGSAVVNSSSVSASLGSSGMASMLAGNMSTATTLSSAHTANISTGARNVAESANQAVHQAAHERTRLARQRQSASLREVAESDSVEMTTRVVANYNHMHSLTIQYYEVEQIYRLETRVTDAERLIFLPIKPIDFQDHYQAKKAINRYRNELTAITSELGMSAASAAINLGRLKESSLSARHSEILRRIRDTLENLMGTKWRQETYGDVSDVDLPYVVVLRWAGDERESVGRLIQDILFENGTTEGESEEAGKLLAMYPPSDIASFARRAEATKVIDQLSALGAIADIEYRGHTDVIGVEPAIDDANENLATARLNLSHARARLRHLRARNKVDSGHPDSTMEDEEDSSKKNKDSRNSDLAAREEAQRAVQRRVAQVRLGQENLVTLKTDLKRLNQELADLRQLQEDSVQAALMDDATLFKQLSERSLEINQGLWLRLDPSVTAGLIETRAYRGETLRGVVDPTPVSVHGNMLGFRWRHADHEHGKRFIATHVGHAEVSHSVAVPTGGLFGEAVLGSSNASEKIDLTRFWNWSDSLPPIRPTTIAPMQVEDASEPLQGPTANGVQSSNIQVGPIAFPQIDSRTEAVGSVLANNELFRDMSGRETAAALAEHAAKLTSKGAIEAGKKATENFKRFLKFQQLAGSAVIDALQRPPIDPTMTGGALNAKDEAKGNDSQHVDESMGGNLDVTFISEDETSETAGNLDGNQP